MVSLSECIVDNDKFTAIELYSFYEEVINTATQHYYSLLHAFNFYKCHIMTQNIQTATLSRKISPFGWLDMIHSG